MNQKTILFTMLALILSMGFTRQVFAQYDDLGSPDFIKSRTYIGVMGTSSTIDQWGDFNGTLAAYYEPATVESGGATDVEQDILPSVQRNYGFGVLLGHREGPWACEFSFWRSDHTATYTGGGVTFNTPASLQSLDINLKRYFFTESPIQPFVNLGVAFPWLWVRQGSTIFQPGTNNQNLGPAVYSDDETFSGIGFDLGAGLEIYLDNGFSLFGGVFQRWTGFNQTSGAYKQNETALDIAGSPANGSLEGDGLNLYVGTSFGIE
jgi:hypothetical protein